MFAKRKQRRSHARKPFRRRIRRKGVVLRPETPAVAPPAFDASSPALYLWIHQRPLSLAPASAHRFTASLKDACASVLAANAESVSPQHLLAAPWACWRPVWREILRRGHDLPEIFRMFAVEFGHHRSFACHGQDAAAADPLHAARRGALAQCLIPVHSSHRLENIFSNVSIPDFVSFASRPADAVVVIDVSKMRDLPTLAFLAMCSLPSLRALSLSYNGHIDDQFLYTLGTTLVQKHSNLRILRLAGCVNISNKALHAFLRDTSSTGLALVESEVRLKTPSAFLKLLDPTEASPVLGLQWRLLNSDAFATRMAKYLLALKLHYLLRIENTPQRMVLDYKFFPQVISSTESYYQHSLDAWKTRKLGATSSPLHAPYMYMKDDSMKIEVESEDEETQEVSLVFKRAGHAAPAAKPKRRKLINANALAFFGTI